jgi:hypothetical protein
LTRAAIDVETPWGLVPGKVYQLPDGQVLFSPEYDACREIAAEEGLRLSDVTEEVRACYETQSEESEETEPSDELSDYQQSKYEQVDAPKLFEGLMDEPSSIPDEVNDRDDQDDREGGDHGDETNWYRWDSSPWSDR